MVGKCAQAVANYANRSTGRRVLADVAFTMLAILVTWALWVGVTHRENQATNTSSAASLIGQAVCRQSILLITLSLEDKTESQREEILRKAAVYIAPVSEALVKLGLGPCSFNQ